MNKQATAGTRFRAALSAESPLQIIGAINAYHALLATQTGYKALYLSGGGVAAGSLGIPDLGISTLEDVLIDVRRITDVTETPLLVDIDTGLAAHLISHVALKALLKLALARCILKTKCKPNVAATARTKQLSAKRKWSTALKRQWTQKRTQTL